MKENKNTRSQWLHLRLTKDEYELLQKRFAQSTERKLSQYARKIFLGEPVIKGYRNLSLDTLIAEFVSLNKTLNGIANNYNQSIHKLHTFDQVPQVKAWLSGQAEAGKTLLESMGEIRSLIRKMVEHDSGH